MEFYKIYCSIHRRTDYWKVVKVIDTIVRPEYYKQLRLNYNKSLRKLSLLNETINNVFLERGII